MSFLELEKMIYDIYRGGGQAGYERDKGAFISDYDLSSDEERAVRELDYSSLYDIGVHPMLCMYFARANGLSVPEYLAAVASSDR